MYRSNQENLKNLKSEFEIIFLSVPFDFLRKTVESVSLLWGMQHAEVFVEI